MITNLMTRSRRIQEQQSVIDTDSDQNNPSDHTTDPDHTYSYSTNLTTTCQTILWMNLRL